MSRGGGAVNDELRQLEELATDAIGELQEAVGELNAVLGLLENSNGEEVVKVQPRT